MTEVLHELWVGFLAMGVGAAVGVTALFVLVWINERRYR